MKVLYVCPFAHYSGHHPHVATVEPAYLERAGLDVTLLTFSGIINDTKARVRHERVFVGHLKLQRLFIKLRAKTLPRWVLMFMEMSVTLWQAIHMYRKQEYDIIHLRDGEPFFFLSHLLSLPYRNVKWFVSLTAAIIFKPRLAIGDFVKRPFVCLYTVVLYSVVNNRIWRLLYRLSMKRNKHMYAPQNNIATEKYKQYMGGMFKNVVVCVELGVGNHIDLLDKYESREHLNLPKDDYILLSFGAPNAGKDMGTMFHAVGLCPEAHLVHGGTHTFSLGSNPEELAKKYCLNGKSSIFNYFISEEDKPYFFGAADAIILSYTKAFASTSSMMWEAARYGVPVISSDANSLGRDVKEYGLGLLFEAENPKSLAEAIKRYKTLTPEKIQTFKDNCRKFVNDHSDVVWAEKCKKVYERLMK